MAVNDPQEKQWKITVSELALDDLSTRLCEWITPRLDADAPVQITHIDRPDAGMSGATVVFDAEWTSEGASKSGSYVMRMPPWQVPLMRTYDLEKQYAVMAAVAATGVVPLPELCWEEPDETVLGAPFFVMRKVDGRIPSDNPPYVFLGWVMDSSPDERFELMRNSVGVLAKLHAIPDVRQRFPMLCPEGESLRCHVDETRAWYRWALVDEGLEIPLIERGFDWLEANWPAETGPDVLSWGDSRPANIIYDGLDPAAVIDWEMAALGPRELDIAWIIYMHACFQYFASMHGAPGLPDFFRRDDVVECYRELSGHTPQELDFYLVYSAVRHAIAMARGKVRMIRLDEDVAPADLDDYVMQRPLLTALLEGTHKWE